MGVLPVLVLLALFHAAAVGAGVYLTNVVDPTGTPFYGGDTGFLPGATSAYGGLTSFLAGDARPEVAAPSREGGLSIFRYALTVPLCTSVDVTKQALNITTFNHPIVQVIPSVGFGLWVKLVIHAVSTVLTLVIFERLVVFLVRAGILSNPYVLGALGIGIFVGLLSTIANGTGALGC